MGEQVPLLLDAYMEDILAAMEESLRRGEHFDTGNVARMAELTAIWSMDSKPDGETAINSIIKTLERRSLRR